MDSLSHQQINLNKKLEIVVSSLSLKCPIEITKKGANVNYRSKKGKKILHMATTCFELPIAKHLIELGVDPYEVSKKYSQDGYTPLHFACLKGNDQLVELLITDYHVDPIAVAADGIQPIHIAIFEDNISITQLLLNASVSTETRITKAIFEKYYEPKSYRHQQVEWRSDYGDSVTLLTYAVIYNKYKVVNVLMENGANTEIKNSNGKTLLMSAVHLRLISVVRNLVPNLSSREINRVDKDGLTALHYLFKEEIKRYSKSLKTEGIFVPENHEILELLFDGGADICSLVRGDPASLLVNMAAYLHEYKMLNFLLPRQRYLSIAKPLFYATLPNSVNYPSKYLRLAKKNVSDDTFSCHVLEIIIKDIKLRLAFGWRILPEEIQIMNNSKFIYPRHDFIPITVANSREYCTMEYYGKVSVFDYCTKSLKELQKLARDEEFLGALKEIERTYCYTTQMIVTMLKDRLRQALRDKLSIEVKKLAFFSETMFYYIPFDCTLKIVEYLDVDDLESFIHTYKDDDQKMKIKMKHDRTVGAGIPRIRCYEDREINSSTGKFGQFNQLGLVAPSLELYPINDRLQSEENEQKFYSLWN